MKQLFKNRGREKRTSGQLKKHLSLQKCWNVLLLKSSNNAFQNHNCFEYVISRVDKGETVDEVYLDFQNAFDKMPHRCLICCLKAHGIG